MRIQSALNCTATKDKYLTMSHSGAGAAGLPPCKRYIATHDANGTSIYADSPEQVFNVIPDGMGGVARSYSVKSVPANLTNDEDVKAYRAEEGATSYTR